MAEKNQGTSIVLFFAPAFIFIVLDTFGPPAIDLLLNERFWIPYVYYSTSILIGYLLFRRSRVVKDMEWHRSRSIQRLEKVYKAEDRGVWLRSEAADNRLNAAAMDSPVHSQKKAAERLAGSISELNREGGPTEIESDETDVQNVELFLEQEHVARNTERVTGKSGPVESVKGVTLTTSENESEGLFQGAIRRISEARESAAQSRINSNDSPPDSSIKTRNSISMADDSSTERIYVRAGEDYDPSPNSLKSMPIVTPSPVEPVQVAIRRCGECGSPMGEDESYCPKCGSFSS